MSFLIEKLENMESRFYKNIESNNLNSKKLEIIESKRLDYKRFSPCESALDSMSRPFPPIENLRQIHRAKIYDKQDSKIMESKKIDSINLSPTHHPIKINMKG